MQSAANHRKAAYPCALTIAGSDSGGGAGIQADIKTFSALGVYGASVITALTAQNTRGIRAVHAVPVDMIAAQIDAVLEDMPINAVKIGMLSSTDAITVVADRLRVHGATNIVLDPVMVATSGTPLLHPAAIAALKRELLPRTTMLTPNLLEAACLLEFEEIPDAEAAARELLSFGPQAVLLKGGHGIADELTDVLVLQDGTTRHFIHPRMNAPHAHGTGCALSSAIAAGLAKGQSLPDAVEMAITWLQGAIAHAWPLGGGHGPVHHYWQLWPAAKDADG